MKAIKLKLILLILSCTSQVSADDTLTRNEQLRSNQHLASNNGDYRLIMQGDGNLVLRNWNTREALWSTGTHKTNANRVRLQSDGNLVLRNSRQRAIWSSKTHGEGVTKAVMQNDGNFVLYNGSGSPVWATGTAQDVPDTIKPVISLIGDQTLTIYQGTTFNDPGATASDNEDGNITSNIQVSGEVNPWVLGSYNLQYDVQDEAGNSADSVNRVVQVVEPAATVIGNSLTQNQQLALNERLMSTNGEYILVMQTDGNLVLRNVSSGSALWASATNSAIRFRLQGDGNLVLINVSGGAVWSSQTNGSGGVKLTLQNDGNLVLRDAEGNPVWATDTSQDQSDTTAPEITLLGGYSVVINRGELFFDPGATAVDDVDGDITDNIVVTGQLNTSLPGTYSLFYDVQDSSGNQADTKTRLISVIQSDDDDPGNDEGNAQSRGLFSTPNAALYRMNDSRPAAFPRIIDTGFEGNGHSETWDGRIFVRKRSQGWFASAFRPERITRNNDGSVNFRNGAFGNSVLLEARDATPDIHQNWLAIVPDLSVEGENPYPSNSSGNFDSNGTYATYKTIIYQTSTRNGDNDQMGFRPATFIVRDANTRNAQITSARFTSGFEKLRLTSGQDFRCIEPSATMDARLIICQGHPNNNGRIDNLVYSWNVTAGGVNNWSIPKSIANMYWDDRDADVDGVKFSVRFPIAEQPLKDATGNDYDRNELVKGAYPWVSHDGAELFYQASREGVSARRTATTVVGRWTGWIFRHIDGPINPNRHRDTRLFISSPGAFTTMWTPYQQVDDLKIPYTTRGPSYPIFGSNNHDYSEVGFDDYLDGNFILYLGMNEQIDRGGAFLKTRTPDTSGNFNNGTLVNAEFPLEFNSRDELAGRYGQAIYFPRNSRIDIAKNNGWDTLTENASVDFWLRKENGSGTIPVFTLDNGIEISILNGNRINAQITDINNNSFEVSGGMISNNDWQHVAVTLDSKQDSLSLYIDGLVVGQINIDGFTQLDTSGSLSIGPMSANALLLLDEVKVSNVARQRFEIQHYANRSTHQVANNELQASIPDYLQTLRFNVSGVDRFSSAAADLGEQLFNDTILSKSQTTSCATCHDPDLAFTDGKPIAQGNEPTDAGERNSPSLQNRLFSSLQGWSGSALTLDKQALIPIQAEHEMNLPMNEAIQRLNANNSYRNSFAQVYGETPTAENIAAALASFQAMQFSPRNRVDQYLAGNKNSLTSQEKRGMDLFNRKARCAGCHSGVNYTDESFRNNGLTSDEDIGRADQSDRDRDYRLFKVPTLRQLGETAPYMHDGSIETLQQVVQEYNAGALSENDRDTDIRPLELSAQEIDDLVAFLEALTN